MTTEILGISDKQEHNSDGDFKMNKKFWVNVSIIFFVSIGVSVLTRWVELKFFHKMLN